MWRWVTRGLVLTFLTLLLIPAAFAQNQNFIGDLELPRAGETYFGVVPVKGWALDKNVISKIELYVDDQFQHRVVTNLPYIDLSETYPQWPGIHHATPGFQTGFLASRFPNGTHTVYVKVFATNNTVTELGRRTIIIDNTQNQAPFGSVDIPDLSGIYNAAGAFPVSGWAADSDGIVRVDVKIDGLNAMSAMYGDPRPDVGNTYPDFAAALFSGFIANVDTTRFPDGVHVLTVHGVDRLGMSREIGRRTIQIFNSDTNLKPFGYLDEPKRDAVLYGTRCNTVPIVSPPVNPQAHITPVRGWALDLATRRDVGRVSYVELLIDGVPWFSSADCAFNPIFGAYTNCYGLPRYDVQRYFPTYPDAPRAGFMFTMDVGALFALGIRPGNHVLKVRVGDQNQTFTDLPNRDGIPVFFACAEDNQDFPSSGFIDIPTTYDYVSGKVMFQGWATDENGGVAALEIIIDGDYIGQAALNFPRPDVAAMNPHLINAGANNSGWRFEMDTTKLSNSRHRLTARVVDGSGRRAEIGSVDFYVQNAAPVPEE